MIKRIIDSTQHTNRIEMASDRFHAVNAGAVSDELIVGEKPVSLPKNESSTLSQGKPVFLEILAPTAPKNTIEIRNENDLEKIAGRTVIHGNLIIKAAERDSIGARLVKDFHCFDAITKITGSLIIEDYGWLTKLEGFDNLEEVYGIELKNLASPASFNIEAFNKVRKCDVINLEHCDCKHVNAFNALPKCRRISIENCRFFTGEKTGFGNLKSIEFLQLIDSRRCKNVAFLEAVEKCSSVYLSELPNYGEFRFTGYHPGMKVNTLTLQNMYYIDSLKDFESVSDLTCFTMTNCRNIDSLEGIQHHAALKRIHLIDNVGPANVDQLSAFKQLDELTITGNATMKSLAGVKQIKCKQSKVALKK